MNSVGLNMIPAGKPPPGITPNFNAAAPAAPALYAIGGLLVAVMCLFLVLLAYEKVAHSGKALWADFTITVGALGAIYYFIICVLSIKIDHFDRHIWDVPASVAASRPFLIVAYLSDAFPTIPFYSIRVSFMLLYFNIFKSVKWVRVTCHASLALMSIFYIPYFIAQLVLTTPRPGQTWLENIQTTRFEDSPSLAVPLASVNLLFDLVILAVPLLAIAKMDTSRTRKIEVSLVFSAAAIAIVASTLSVVYRARQQINLGDGEDVTYWSFPVEFTSLVEMSVGVIVFCMLNLSGLFRKLFRGKAATPHDSGTARRHFVNTQANMGHASTISNTPRTESGAANQDQKIGSSAQVHPSNGPHSTYNADPGAEIELYAIGPDDKMVK